MKYWACTLNEDNWLIVQEKLILGVPSLTCERMMKVMPHDLLVLSVNKSKKPSQPKIEDIMFTGIFRAVSKPYKNKENIGFKPYSLDWAMSGVSLYLFCRVKIEPYRLGRLTLLQVSKKWKWPENRLIESWIVKSPKIFAFPGSMEELPEEFFQSIMNQFPPLDSKKQSPTQGGTCQSCGETLPRGAIFCPSCGKRITHSP